MKLTKLVKLLCLLNVLGMIACSQTSALKVVDPKCENLRDPLAINTSRPRFSWKLNSETNGSRQTAYQLLVASTPGNLSEEQADCWNSGKILSPEKIMIDYKGKELQPGELFYWKVRVWDENDNVSDWSKTASFGIGLLDESNWKAAYIGYPSEDGFFQTPQFRRLFKAEKAGRDEVYLLHVNSLGYHEIHINGQKVGDAVLSPAVSQFNKRSLINTYDVTSYIKRGENNLIIWLGSGWYSEGLPGVTGKGPAVRAQLAKVSGNRPAETIVVTDDSWSARNSEYTRISNWWTGRYGGEEISGNLETQNLPFTEPEKLTWNKVTLVEVPNHTATPQMVEPNRIMQEFTPLTIVRLNDSTFLVDMGTTLTGWFEITFPRLEKGDQVVMEYADHLDENGQIAKQGQIDRYIASGNGTERFRNRFNYHGFRYVKISNLREAPEKSAIKALLIHTDFETASDFECSDTDLNRIHDMIHYTLRCLGLGGYLVDCPQIERLGYGGDGNASTLTAQTMFNLAPLYNNWLDAWSDVIREDGSMPHTAPNPYAAGGGPYWCGFIISASWHTYRNYGDIRILERYYPVMQKWLEYVDKYSPEGLLKRWPDTDYRNWYLGDWATPDGVGNPNHLDERSVDLVNNCYLSVCFSQMAEIAGYLGKSDERRVYLEKKEQLNRRIHETYFDNEKGYYATGSQIDLTFPMLAGAVPTELRDKLIETLKEKTEQESGGHLNTGLVGIPVVMEWATSNNQPDFVYSMLKKRTYPGYLFMLENGATTTWEHWNGARSRIHNCFNGVGQWFYESVGGIRQIEGKTAYSELLIDPQIPSGVTWAKTRINTPNGWVSLHWESSESRMKMELEIPVGSRANIKLPDNVTEATVNRELQTAVGQLVILSSGKYSVEYPLQ